METIPVLRRAISVVEALGTNGGGLTAKQLSTQLGIPPATCYRILRTLTLANWLREGNRGEYHVAFGLFRAARACSDIDRQLLLVRPLLEHLAEETGLSAKISLREGDHAVTAMRAEARRMTLISTPVGARTHLLETGSAGVILLADMPATESSRILSAPRNWQRGTKEQVEQDIRGAAQNGVARAHGTVNPSIWAVSVAVAVPPAQAMALTIVGWPDDFSKQRQPLLEKQLKKCAKAMAKLLRAEYGRESE
jgi:DNA-binding IclR family transcriptional regulator